MSFLEWVDALGSGVGGLAAGFALVQLERARRADDEDKRTAVGAWASMAGDDVRASGVSLTIRNDTTVPVVGASATVLPLDLPPAPPGPNGERYQLASIPVPLVPPMGHVAYTVPGRLFQAYGPGWSEIAVRITFRDSRGQAWTRHADGTLVKGLDLKFRKPAPVYDAAAAIQGRGLQARIRRRRALRGRP